MTTNELPYFKMFASHWILNLKVRAMKPHQRGAYIDLLCHDWISNGIPDNAELCALITGIAVDEVSDIMKNHFTIQHDGKLSNKKLNEQKNILRKTQKGCIKAAKKRWEERNANALPTHSERNTNKNKKENKNLEEELDTEKELKKSLKSFKNISFGIEHSERAEKLRDHILSRDPKAKTDINKWADEVRLMVERDGRTLDEIDRVIEFSQTDTFWSNNILSMGKLRKQFTALLLKSQTPQTVIEKRQEATLEAGRKFVERGKNRDGEGQGEVLSDDGGIFGNL